MTQTSQHKRTFTSAVLRKETAILMVKHQGKNDPEAYWSLPGGRVEVGEMPMQAIIREVKEETGLDVQVVGEMVYQVDITFGNEDALSYGTAYVYEIDAWSGEFDINDPDDKVQAVAFVPLQQALTELAKIDYMPMQAPAIAYLTGAAPAGTVYCYRVRPHQTPILLDC